MAYNGLRVLSVRDRRRVSGSPVDPEHKYNKNCQTATATRML